MKLIGGILLSTIVAGTNLALADTENLNSGETYIGKEAYNENPTGNQCSVKITSVQAFPEKGLHCHTVEFTFSSPRTDLPRQTLRVASRVTNYHRPEFPKLRTCAVNVNGSTAGNDIYGEDTTFLYNQIFGGSHDEDGTRFDYFLTLSPGEKKAVRARIHVMTTFDEYDIDCAGLQLTNIPIALDRSR